jgi:methionyl aminopeptidase
MSPNAQVVHGIPNNTPLVSGDIISIDCGAYKWVPWWSRLYVWGGRSRSETKKLLQVTKNPYTWESENLKLETVWKMLVMQFKKYTESHGYGVVRELVGHGLGQKNARRPWNAELRQRGRGKLFVEGMVVALEPMINQGTHNQTAKDGRTQSLTADGKPSAHFEHVALVDGNQNYYLRSHTFIRH